MAADEQFHQVIAGNVFYYPPAALGDNAVASHKADADAEIAQSPVAVAQRSVRRRGQQTADCGALRMRRIDR